LFTAGCGRREKRRKKRTYWYWALKEGRKEGKKGAPNLKAHSCSNRPTRERRKDPKERGNSPDADKEGKKRYMRAKLRLDQQPLRHVGREKGWGGGRKGRTWKGSGGRSTTKKGQKKKERITPFGIVNKDFYGVSMVH